jgi:hypothetical protein
MEQFTLVITVKVILLSWLFGRNTCKFVVPWRYDKTRINCNGLLNLSNELEKKKHKKKPVTFSYAMVNLGILKITFNCFLTYKAIQTRPLVLLVDSPYKSCIAPPSDPLRACWCQCTWYKWYFFQCKWRYKRRMKMMIMKKILNIITCIVHPRNDSWAELVLANIYYFIDVS